MVTTELASPPPRTPVPGAPAPAGADDGPASKPRVLPLVVAFLLVLAVTFGAAYGATRLLGGDDKEQDPSGQDSESPTPGATDEPTDEESPLGEPAEDIDFPALQLPAGQQYDTHVVRSGGHTWTYPIPVGWVAYRVGADNADAGVLPEGRIDSVGHVRWRPAGEPLVGGFSIRLRVLATPARVPEMVDTKVAQLQKLQDPDVYDQTADTIYFTYRDGNNRVRYNFFRWLPNAAGEASLEISVSGRTVDKDGLADLLEAVADGATVASR